MRLWLLCCACVLASVTLSAEGAGVRRALGDDSPTDTSQLRPFASKDQARQWRTIANRPWYPKGGVCLPNMFCACSQPRDIDGTCPGNLSCQSATSTVYCVYLCYDPMACMSKTAAECTDSEPCNP